MADWNSDDTDADSHTSTPTTSLIDVPAANYSTMFDCNQPLVLELHDLKKDEPATATTTAPDSAPALTESKTKKKKKKNRVFSRDVKEVTSAASISSSEAAMDIASKEEFYDARESYHGIENAPPVQVVGSDITPPVLTNSLGSSTTPSLPSNVLDTLKMTGSIVPQPEVTQQETGSQAAIQKPTAPPS